MTYRVLIVDDEPIILSGIKFLIDWEKNNCQIAATARNGKQALEAIRSLTPHIVICDINMPVMTGIEVLKTASESSPLPVFIMLTNYGEFDLAREALRYHAADYLLKSQLEVDALEKSLALAKQEYERRSSLVKVDMASSYIRSNQSQIIAQSLKNLIFSGKNHFDDSIRHLEKDNIFEHFCFISLFMDFSLSSASDTFSETDNAQLFAWEQEVVEKLSGNTFSNYTVFDPDNKKQSLLIYCFHIEGDICALTKQFYQKLCSVSNNITQVKLSLLSTEKFDGSENLASAIAQYHQLCEYYYYSQCSYMLVPDLPKITYETLSFGAITNKIIPALRAKNPEQCDCLIAQTLEMVMNIPHRKSDCIRECTSLYGTVSSILSPMLSEHQANDYFTDNTSITHQISCFSTRSAAKLWLTELGSQIKHHLEQLTMSKSYLAEKIRSYVIENVDKRIMQQDVADYMHISPSYLSALFKKEYNQNFVDFINETKMERACSLICENKYRIYEISYMLGFDNAYYFTKVFKKHTGLTPTEYQRKMRL